MAKSFNIPEIYTSLEEMLEDENVQVIDIAIPVEAQYDVVRQAAQHGKHILCQKPLAPNYSEGKKIVEICEKAGVLMAVNQQMRWSPSIHACKDLIDRKLLGDLVQIAIQVNVNIDWSNWE